MSSSIASFDAAWAIAVEFVMAMSRLALAAQINIQLPDEKSRRVGQSIAAASLPYIA